MKTLIEIYDQMNSSLPLVTIMIPTYQHENYIQQAIQSALDQDYKNLEIIVSDDCSDDNTYKKARAMDDPRLSVHRNETNLGFYQNYQKLLYKYANGKWVIMLDGDNIFNFENYISHCVRNFCSKASLNLVFANIYCETADDSYKVQYDYPRIFNGRQIIRKLFWPPNISINHDTSLYRRKLALDIGFYKNDNIFPPEESMIKLASQGRVGYVDKYAVTWGFNQTSQTQKFSPGQNFGILDNFFSSVIDHYHKHVTEPRFNKFLEQKLKVEFIFENLLPELIKENKFDEIENFINNYKTWF